MPQRQWMPLSPVKRSGLRPQCVSGKWMGRKRCNGSTGVSPSQIWFFCRPFESILWEGEAPAEPQISGTGGLFFRQNLAEAQSTLRWVSRCLP